MEFLSKILPYIPLIATLVIAYLGTNKVWKRKHEKPVAQSISLVARAISIVTNLTFMIQSFSTIFIAINFGIWLIVEIILVLIGSGLWVAGEQKKSFWQRIKEALKLESEEAGDLAKSLFRPSNADNVLTILGRLALVDNQLDQKEKEILQSFADDWKVNFDPNKISHLEESDQFSSFDRLRKDVEEYLTLSPPDQQVSQLADIMQSLIKIDGDVSKEEELIVEELLGLINGYLDKHEEDNRFYIAIVPQDTEQETAIKALISDTERKKVAGGLAYVNGPYFSRKYSEILSEQYHQLNCLAVVVAADQVKEAA
ncbi:MAG: hypothetical protein R8G66_28240 [Cytophagales bacterium]|nr:hypothetical protein [Cytophagales bacterium]